MKKWLSIILVTVLCFTLALAGCQPQTSGTTGTTTKSGETTKGTTGSTTASAGGYQLSAAGELPIVVGDKATLKVFYVPSAYVTDMTTNYATKWFEDKTNVKVDWMLTSSADSTEKLSLLLAANAKSDMPDVFLCGISRAVAEAYGVQGVLMDLSSLINDYGVNMKKLFERNDKLEKQMTAYDGKKYFLFRYYETVHVTNTQKLWMDMQWLKNLGLQTPKTTDEFYTVLKAFKTEDANGNGDANDEIPFIHYTDGWMSAFGMSIMNSFVYSPAGDNKLYYEDGKVKVSYAQDGWKEALRYYKKLYDEGLMDNECFSMTLDQAKALGAATTGNRVGCLTGGTEGIHDFADPVINEFEVIDPLKGPTGLQQAAYELFNPTPFFAISSYCTIPEIAYRWADAQLYDSSADIAKGDYTWLNLWYGEEGVGWEKAKTGAVGFTGEQAAYKWLFNWGENTNTHWYETFLINMPSTWKPLIAADMGAGYQQEKILYDATIEHMKPYSVDKTLPTVSLDEATSVESAELETNLITYYKEMEAKFVRGEADLDKDWDAYLAELKNIGLDRYLEIYQTAYKP
ncbi:MAG: extracellular solute-binding protein [Clostridiaceae bacterium]|nr:extracellular solute-binding protein [Clostridiaceae bacterium]